MDHKELFQHANMAIASDEENSLMPGIKIPEGHKNMKDGDPTKCPFYEMQQKSNQLQLPSKAGECPVKGKEPKDPNAKKEKKPKGGCPFMTSDKKKNPPLECISNRVWGLPYISPMKFILSFKGFMKPEEIDSKRQKFDSYPIYLQHTIFHDDEHMQKARKIELCQRFFIFDTYREKGNKHLFKGEYDEAIKYFERALSCIKWLEYKKPEKKAKTNTGEISQESQVIKEKIAEGLRQVNQMTNTTTDTSKENSVTGGEMKIAETKEKVDEPTTDQQEEGFEYDREMDSLLATYTDENVILHDGEECTEDMDKDMRKSSLLQLYLNIAVTYIRLNHFSMARLAIQDAMAVTDKSSQVYFRRSQTIACNKESTLEELMQAKKDIEIAIDMKRFEKIFQSEPGVLKILNLHNVDEAYIAQAHFVQDAIRSRREWEFKFLKEIIARGKERLMLQEAYGRPRSQEKCNDHNNQKATTVHIEKEEDQHEFEIAQEVVAKYSRILEFYHEGEHDKPENIKGARKELLTAKDILCEMTFIRDIDFQNYKKNPLIMEILDEVSIELDDPDVQRLLNRIKVQKIKEIFEIRGNEYNFEVFKYAVDSYYKRKEQTKKEEEESQEMTSDKPKQSFVSHLFRGFWNANFGLQFLVLVLILIIFYFVNRNTGLFNNLLFKGIGGRK